MTLKGRYKNGGEIGIRTLDTLLTYAGLYQRHPAFDPSGAEGVKKCSRHFFQDQARYKRNGGFGAFKACNMQNVASF